MDWLAVGHVDEIIQFLPADGTLRGWALYIADPVGGIGILQGAAEKGYGNVAAFSGANGTLPQIQDDVPGVTLAELLTDKLVAENIRLAEYIDSVEDVLLQETGIPSQDIHRVPVIFTTGPRMPCMETWGSRLNTSMTSTRIMRTVVRFIVAPIPSAFRASHGGLQGRD